MLVRRGVAVGLLALLVASFLLLTAGCSRCSGPPPLAKLNSKSGQVDRDRASERENWEMAEVGGTYAIGDAVRTGPKATAALDLDDGSRLQLQEVTIVRFLDRNPDSPVQSFDLEMGTASLETSADGMMIETSFGVARLEGGTRVILRRDADRLRYEVEIGSAEFDGADGKVEVEAGHGIAVDLGAAVVEEYEIGQEGEPPEPEPEPEPEPDVEVLSKGDIQAEVRGPGARTRAPGESKSERLEEGSQTLAPGSVLELANGTEVDLTRGKDQVTLRGRGTFVVGAGDAFIEARDGTLSATSGNTVRIAVPGGVIVASRGGSAEIQRKGGETQVRALGPTVRIEGETTEELGAGEEGALGKDGKVEVVGRGLPYADIEIQSGETVTVHDPKPPTAVRFLFGAHCEQGVIRLSGKSKDFARGSKSVAMPLQPGTTSYSLHCSTAEGDSSSAAASGRITILRDAGTASAPKDAPATYIEADGRSYTVLYQNQLPRVTVSWSKAPQDTSAFQVHLAGSGGERVLSSKRPTYTFSSGALREGTHRIYLEGGGRVSRQSTLTIRFDNAASTATLSTPSTLAAAPGEEVTIHGTALPGWSVSIDGKEVGQDGGNRFAASAKVPDEKRAIAVRLTHPSRGTHIYLRRSDETP